MDKWDKCRKRLREVGVEERKWGFWLWIGDLGVGRQWIIGGCGVNVIYIIRYVLVI